MPKNYSNTAAKTTLTSAVTATATSIAVGSTTGFPAAPFTLAIDLDTVNEELILVTGVSGLNLTVTRGHDGTTKVTHDAGATVQHCHSAEDFALSRAHEDATTNVHGRTSPLVGTTDTQALTNKDLSSPTNTFPGTLATTTGVSSSVSSAVSSHSSASTGVHGVSGSVVGTSSTQTLTNKTINVANNSVTGLPASSLLTSTATGQLSGTAKATPDGAVVGTTDNQTLSNKVLDATNDLTAFIQQGSTTITPTGANQTTTQPITFPKPFDTPPLILLQILTGVAANVGCVVWPGSVTTTGFDLALSRGNTTPTNVRWVAIRP